MEYLKKILKSLKDIVIVLIIQYAIIYGMGVVYLMNGGDDIIAFYTKEVYFALNALYIIYVIYFWKKYREKETRVSIGKYYAAILLGVSFACFCNMIFFKLGYKNEVVEINKIMVIFTSGILGPILEELLFRKHLLSKLLEFNSKKVAILLSALLFSFFHHGISFVYAFFMGLLLGVIYEKFKNIKVTILIHMVANITVIFLTGYNVYILIISLIGFIASLLLMFDKKVRFK